MSYFKWKDSPQRTIYFSVFSWMRGKYHNEQCISQHCNGCSQIRVNCKHLKLLARRRRRSKFNDWQRSVLLAWTCSKIFFTKFLSIISFASQYINIPSPVYYSSSVTFVHLVILGEILSVHTVDCNQHEESIFYLVLFKCKHNMSKVLIKEIDNEASFLDGST